MFCMGESTVELYIYTVVILYNDFLYSILYFIVCHNNYCSIHTDGNIKGTSVH